MKKKEVLYRVISVFFLLTWMTIIFAMSAMPAEESQEQSYEVGRAIAGLIQKVEGGVWSQAQKQEFAEAIDFYVRKSAHASEYAILGMLWLGTFISFGRNLVLSRWYARGFGTIFAISDEIHQYFVPGRACQVRDMLIDSVGVLIGVLIFAKGYEIRAKRQNKTKLR